MRIGELAQRSGTTPRALRYYEQQGLLRPVRTSNGYRAYSEESVLHVQQIRGLLAAGFSSQTVAQLLPCARGVRPAIELCPSVVAAMQQTLDRIESKLEVLNDHRAAVAALLADDDAAAFAGRERGPGLDSIGSQS
jgi:DNA-binding transcriptional MerR regulator